MKKKEHIVPGYNMLQRYVLRLRRPKRHFSGKLQNGLCTAGLQTLSNYPLSGEHLGGNSPVKVPPFQENWENSWLMLIGSLVLVSTFWLEQESTGSGAKTWQRIDRKYGIK